MTLVDMPLPMSFMMCYGRKEPPQTPTPPPKGTPFVRV